MRLLRLTFSLALLWFGLFFWTPAWAVWPEQGITLLATSSVGSSWSPVPNPQRQVLEALLPRISRELGVPVSLLEQPGYGVMAATLVVGSRPHDGYYLGGLCADTALVAIAQGYTPYTKNELKPVAIGWYMLSAIVMRSDVAAEDLLTLAKSAGQANLRLAHAGLSPVHVTTLMAIEAAKAAGFKWTLEKVDFIDPKLLLGGKVDAVVMPLGYLKHHPQAERFKVITVLTNDDSLPILQGLPTLKSQNLGTTVQPFFAFYVPAKVNRQIKVKLSMAINRAMKQTAVQNLMAQYGMVPRVVDLEGLDSFIDAEYKRIENTINLLELR